MGMEEGKGLCVRLCESEGDLGERERLCVCVCIFFCVCVLGVEMD